MTRQGRQIKVSISLVAALAAVALPRFAGAQSVMTSLSGVQTALSGPLTISQFIEAEAPLFTVGNVEKYGCDVMNFALGREIGTPLTPGPFNANCGTHASGAGYYLVGDTAPGGIVPLNRVGVFLPTHDRGCSEREYSFTFTMDSLTPAFAALGKADDYWNTYVTTKVFPGQSTASLVSIANAYRAMYAGVGNFAIIAVINPFTNASYLYVMAQNTALLDKLAIGDSTARSLNGTYAAAVRWSAQLVNTALAHGVAHASPVAYVHRGSVIHDQFAQTCFSPLLFWYIAGTGKVVLN